jgi:MFS family permease
MSALSLLSGRRFGAMYACITLGAFNDNFYKNALVILITYELAKQMGVDASILISNASTVLILPFFLFSGIAGEFADAMPKHRLVRILKVTEAVLMVLAAAALFAKQAFVLIGLLFLIGMQAAFFGPLKYAILPQLVEPKELLLGNGLVEGGTFLTILLGTLFSGLMVLQPNGIITVSLVLLVLSALGVFAAWRVPETAISNPGLHINYNIFASTWRMLRHAFDNPCIGVPILGISWFWAIGATYLIQLPIFTKTVLGGNEVVVTLFNGVFAVGIALGSFACPYIVPKLHARDLSRLALTGVCLFGLDLCWVGHHIAPPASEDLMGLVTYLTSSFTHIRITLDLFLMAACSGFFIVPLYTQLQTQGDPHQRARTIASNNVMNALFIALASGLSSVLFAQGLSVTHVLLVFALLNVPVIFLLRRMVHGKPMGHS